MLLLLWPVQPAQLVFLGRPGQLDQPARLLRLQAPLDLRVSLEPAVQLDQPALHLLLLVRLAPLVRRAQLVRLAPAARWRAMARSLAM